MKRICRSKCISYFQCCSANYTKFSWRYSGLQVYYDLELRSYKVNLARRWLGKWTYKYLLICSLTPCSLQSPLVLVSVTYCLYSSIQVNHKFLCFVKLFQIFCFELYGWDRHIWYTTHDHLFTDVYKKNPISNKNYSKF